MHGMMFATALCPFTYTHMQMSARAACMRSTCWTSLVTHSAHVMTKISFNVTVGQTQWQKQS